MKRTIYIFSDGEIKRKGNTLYFENESGKKYIPVENCNEILIFGEVSFNKKLLEFLSQHEIILHYFSHYGYYMGSFYPREHYNSGYMIIKQAEHYLDKNKRFNLAKKFVHGAIENMLKVLQYYNRRGKNLESYITSIEDLKGSMNEIKTNEEQDPIFQLMAVEGNIREIYYKSFNKIIENNDFKFETRSRRPPKSRINALISFSNSLVYTVVLSEIYKTHLDPRVGYLHSSNFRRFSLNLDIAEVFKPIIGDRTIFSLINRRVLNHSMFLSELSNEKVGGVVLNDKGRRVFIEEFDNRMKNTIKHKSLKRNVSYRQLILLEVYKVQKHLIGEKEYEPFVAQW
ncbi:MAG: type I-B CRISPR-associated endonuclease Cas1 [Candidatus Marinimicrobia bacterium]|nr:type I-B CRISPR-associated endonuclease Cas1 [Candidatus Neomarinimicrobiota bacterium]